MCFLHLAEIIVYGIFYANYIFRVHNMLAQLVVLIFRISVVVHLCTLS